MIIPACSILQAVNYRSKNTIENLKKSTASKRVWIRPVLSATVAVSCQEDKYDEKKEASRLPVKNAVFLSMNRKTVLSAHIVQCYYARRYINTVLYVQKWETDRRNKQKGYDLLVQKVFRSFCSSLT